MSLFEISLPRSVAKALRLPIRSPRRQQIRVLKKLLKKARFTEFGQQFRFDEILLSNNPVKKFREMVPTFNYNQIYEQWWHRALEGKRDVCWPGKVKYFALSSGTSESSSKYIPVTTDLMKGNRIVMLKQLLTLRNYTNFPVRSIGKGWLLISGSTDLQKGPGYYAGDLSGITTKRLPFWFTPFYKPGKKIARQRDWNKKLDEIVENAPAWDISFIIGVPAWNQMVMERIIERHNLQTIHDIWPNLTLFVHGGVSFEPYKKGFEKLLAKPLIYIETYLASEGFLAYQDSQAAQGMRLVTGEHIFFEFVPFNDENFDPEGNMIDQPQALMIHEVEEGKDYAILISTSAGAWRYLIGDTIRFVNKEKSEIIITGRTKHFLSLVGEHLSVDNMTRAIQMVSNEMNVSIPEFTVAGVSHESNFSHDWFVGSNDQIDANLLCKKIDANLQSLNDDYAVERRSELIDISVNVFPEQKFIEFMRRHGKVGGQHKFPRVLKGKLYEDWKEFIANGNA